MVFLFLGLIAVSTPIAGAVRTADGWEARRAPILCLLGEDRTGEATTFALIRNGRFICLGCLDAGGAPPAPRAGRYGLARTIGRLVRFGVRLMTSTIHRIAGDRALRVGEEVAQPAPAVEPTTMVPHGSEGSPIR
jgi:hypothetical protein